MVTLLHISDLHFGRAHARRMRDAILRTEAEVRPTAVVCSGDLVEWSETNGPWREVKAFLESLVAPLLVIPGNHDIERINVVNRLLAPFNRYQRFVRPELDTHVEVPGAVLVGLGTPRRWCIDLGHVSRGQLDFAQAAFAKAPVGALKVVALHHGLLTHSRFPLRSHVWGDKRARRELLTMGADLVLTGHAHFPRVEPIVGEGRRLVWAQAGSAGSHRLPRRCARNSLNVVRATPDTIEIEWWYHDPERHVFEHAETHRHPRRHDDVDVSRSMTADARSGR